MPVTAATITQYPLNSSMRAVEAAEEPEAAVVPLGNVPLIKIFSVSLTVASRTTLLF